MAKNTVRVNVIGDASKLQQAFGQGGTAAEKFQAKMKLVATAVVAALAFKALGAVKDFVGDSVRAFSDLNESLNAVEVTFGKNAAGIKKLGEQAARTVGLSNAEFNSFAVSMAAFAEQIAGPGGDVVGTIEMLIGRAADFASVMNISVSEAMEKFQSGLAGQSRPLREYGIDVSDARIKTFAYTNGIADAGEELTEAQKVMARYGTIMEQTNKVAGDFANTATDYANAQRIANAEMENAKARAGEALVPFAQLTNQLKLMGAQAIGAVSTSLQKLIGNISATDAAIQEFTILMGTSADTAEAALTINREFGQSFKDLIPRLSLSREELVKLRNADEAFLKSIGLTTDEINELSDAVGLELASAMTEAEIRARQGLTPAMEDLTDATEDSADAQRDALAALGEYREGIRTLHDPLGRAIKLTQDLEKADQAVIEAEEQYGRDSPEFRAATLDRIGIIRDMENTMRELREKGIDPTGLAARQMFSEMGVPESVISAIFADWDRMEKNLEDRTFHIPIWAPAVDWKQDGTTIKPIPAGGRAFAHGGIATGPTLGMIGEAGDDEAVIPLNNQGIKILGAALREAMGGSGGLSVVVNAGLGADGDDIGRRIVDAISSYERRNGTAWRAS